MRFSPFAAPCPRCKAGEGQVCRILVLRWPRYEVHQSRRLVSAEAEIDRLNGVVDVLRETYRGGASADVVRHLREDLETADALTRTVIAAREHSERTLRAEIADLRRQNLALDAQLDHMTRVNQALDAGITTTTKQETADATQR